MSTACSTIAPVSRPPRSSSSNLQTLKSIDASIITDHMMMEATYLGLGSVWVCYFKPDILKAEFKIPDNLEPVNILVLGYADTSREKALSADRHAKMRNSLSAMVSFEKL